MLEEIFINDAFDSVVCCDEVKAMRVLKNAEKTGADLVELFMHGYNAGIEHIRDLFCRGEILLPELISSGRVLKTVADEIEVRMALAEIKCAGVDYCFFSEKVSISH